MNAREVTQVFIVTSGAYSDYGIESVWLTREEAEAQIVGRTNDGYDSAHVEVWPIGDRERTLGSFWRSVDLDATTGEPRYPESASDSPPLEEASVSVICWEDSNHIGIRVTEETAERADKVFSEVKARVLADISMGLPKETIASKIYRNGGWHPTRGGPHGE